MVKNKVVKINPKNTNDNNCYQYAITAALNYQNVDPHPERISNLKPFINNYNWKNIEFPTHLKDWRKFERNNKAIALNVLYVPYNAKQEDNEDEDKNGYDCMKEIRLKSENERKYYRGKDCMKMFYNGLKEQFNKINNYEMKAMIPLTNEEKESYESQEICHICDKNFLY